MMDYDKLIAKKCKEMKPSGIRKFFDLAAQMEDVISLGVGEPDFQTPWNVRQAAVTALEKGKTKYTANAGIVELREAVSRNIHKNTGVDYDPKNEIIVTVGGSEGIDISIRALINPGDEVLIVEPCFVCYAPIVSLCGGVPVSVQTTEETEFRLTADMLREKITDKTKLLILPFPNNPTGAVMERKDLEAIAEVIRGTDILILSDEIYSSLTYGGKHCSIIQIDGMKERTIFVNGFSKAYAMTGWRLGYVAGPQPIIKQMLKIHQYGIMSSPTISQYAAIEALDNCDADIVKMRNEYDIRRRWLVNALNDMGLHCFEPKGAFYVFPSIKSTGLSSEEFCERLLYEHNVAVVPGNAFGDCGEGYIRISYAYYRGDRERDPFQTDVVTLSGETDEYCTQFNYKGFRYVQVESSKPIELTDDNLTACFLHSDVPQVGSITASDPIIGKLMHASRMSYLSNLMGLPTDCPQREKNGWTGDGHLAIEAGLYNYDGITIYEKWMQDHRDEQQPNGVLPDIIPTCGWGYGTDNGLDWTSTIAIIPWTLYLFYGDDQALRDCYENIRRYVDYVDNRFPQHLADWGRGDWVPVTVGSNKELTSSVYFYTDARILANAARLFGKTADAERYGRLADDIRQAINDRYLNRETGIYASGTQTEQSVPLYWGVVPHECEALVAKRLNERVQAADYHLDVGVLGCKALLGALSQHGYPETAYRVAVQDSYPSWGWWVRNGSTTLLENWRLDAERDISDNHMMFGEIGAWFYKGLGGIYPDECEPGFRHIRLTPYFPASLSSFSASHTSPYGQIVSSWTSKGRLVNYTVSIPANSRATLTIPDGFIVKGHEGTIELPSGVHEIEMKRIRN